MEVKAFDIHCSFSCLSLSLFLCLPGVFVPVFRPVSLICQLAIQVLFGLSVTWAFLVSIMTFPLIMRVNPLFPPVLTPWMRGELPFITQSISSLLLGPSLLKEQVFITAAMIRSFSASLSLFPFLHFFWLYYRFNKTVMLFAFCTKKPISHSFDYYLFFFFFGG